MEEKQMVDTSFDFTSDTPHYWDGFWEVRNGLGVAGNDPDAMSPTLREYHRILWSKTLPNGEKMELSFGPNNEYLTWGGFSFGSDSIIVSFRYEKYRFMLDKVAEQLPDYHQFVEDYLHKSYTIGGTVTFPKRMGGINQSRGCNSLIRDRWDLTLECIRRYYQGEGSPLYDVLEEEDDFFRLFVDFKGYVDFFFFQDCVDDNYSRVLMFEGSCDFKEDPLPKTVEDYFSFIDAEMAFLEKRNQRIAEWCINGEVE